MKVRFYQLQLETTHTAKIIINLNGE